MIRLETKDDFERARESLRRRDTDDLAVFLLSLAGQPGPIGEQLRTFIGGDDVAATVDSVEQLLLVRDPQSAFDVLVWLFEADAVAMESCGEHEWEVTCAYQRAAEVMAAAARHLPRAKVEDRVNALLKGDGYGVRSVLNAVLSGTHPDNGDGES
jgi:hypothetical protein